MSWSQLISESSAQVWELWKNIAFVTLRQLIHQFVVLIYRLLMKLLKCKLRFQLIKTSLRSAAVQDKRWDLKVLSKMILLSCLKSVYLVKCHSTVNTSKLSPSTSPVLLGMGYFGWEANVWVMSRVLSVLCVILFMEIRTTYTCVYFILSTVMLIIKVQSICYQSWFNIQNSSLIH